MRQLVDQAGCNRNHVLLYLWFVGSVLKHCKVPKYYDQDCSLLDTFLRKELLHHLISMKEVILQIREMKFSIHKERMINKRVVIHMHAKNQSL